MENNLDLALIGNGTFAALINKQASIVWSCLPRLDSDPVFCALLNGRHDAGTEDNYGSDWGFYQIELMDFERSEQRYLTNSAIVETVLTDRHGNAVEILDFAPRYRHYGRYFRPNMIVRMVRPRTGDPRIRIRVRPRFHYGAMEPQVTRGSNHLRYVSPEMVLRLTTNAPISYIEEETPFILDEPLTLILGPDESLTASVSETGRKLFEGTQEYWQEFSRYLSLPFEWQDAVIRAAITLKMCTFEETGAVIAAVTTSLPEFRDSGRNWDYRYCWLRDAYFVIHALNRLGATKTMEDYLRYIANVVAQLDDHTLQPLYSITLDNSKLTEWEVPHLSGFRGMGPVRVGNLAYHQVQNDSYGAVILASTQVFFDRRLKHPGGIDLFERLENLGEKAVQLWNTPDAGLWELRTKEKVHTFSAVMCWAGADRLAKIAQHLGLKERAAYWRRHAEHIREETIERSWNADLNSFVESFGGTELDASLLLLQELGFIEATDPRFLGTVEAIGNRLKHGDMLFRYIAPDDFGIPETSFTICTFWYIDALAAIGRKEEARRMFEKMLESRNHVGLLSEDIDHKTGALWGNFPQTYSMVGLINSAMRLSKSWEEAF